MTTTHRDRYLDALRAVALARVVVFHMVGFAWLSFVFPAMGVMFALGGSLMANSLRRSPTAAVRSRIRRLLPALWVMGAVLVPAMAWHGAAPGDGRELALPRLLLWVVPVADPPGTAWAGSATQVLWYLVTYLWLVLLSPVAWWAYRRQPVPTLLLPLVVLATVQLGPIELDGRAGAVVVDVATFGACWLVGFAHRTGELRRMNWWLLGCLAVGFVAAGAAVAVADPAEGGSLNLNDIPLAQGLYSLGFVLVVLRVSPPMGWLARVRALDATVTMLNSRAVTIYLWHNVAIALCFPVGDLLLVWRLGDRFADLGYFAVALVLLAGVVLGLGWVEDLAARRPPSLLPPGARPARGGRAAGPARGGGAASSARGGGAASSARGGRAARAWPR
jgi:peptidoglycan/LPS O-acetylase OafA/YrhL